MSTYLADTADNLAVEDPSARFTATPVTPSCSTTPKPSSPR
jgi:hypothetical protein